MDHIRHEDHKAVNPHAGHQMSDVQASYDRHAGHSVAMFREKFWWTLGFHHSGGFLVGRRPALARLHSAPFFPGSKFIPAFSERLFSCMAESFFIRGARGELADRKPGMMTLIGLGILVAFVASLAATFGLFEVEVWWELASLITIMFLGHWLEMRAISQARGALNALAALLPDTAERVNGSEIRNCSHLARCA